MTWEAAIQAAVAIQQASISLELQKLRMEHEQRQYKITIEVWGGGGGGGKAEESSDAPREPVGDGQAQGWQVGKDVQGFR